MIKKINKKFMFWVKYLNDPPWDSEISPPELEEFIANNPAGRAIDLGCGTGTNIIRLADAGWDVKGVDFVPKAIRLAKRKIRKKNSSAQVVVGDVSNPKIFEGTYNLVLDMGCYHSLTQEQQLRYLQHIKNHLHDDGMFMIYAFTRVDEDSPPGLSQKDISILTSLFKLQKRENGFRKNGLSSAWFWFNKQEKDH